MVSKNVGGMCSTAGGTLDMSLYVLFFLDVRNVPSNRVISALEGKFGRVGEPFVLVLEGLFMKI